MTTPASHGARRSPATPAEPLDLQATADDLLEQARSAPAGRAALALTPGAGAPLSQTLLAIGAGRALQEHVAPGPATLQVLTGTGALTAGDDAFELAPGQWMSIPPRSHSLSAGDDLVVLLTVAPTR